MKIKNYLSKKRFSMKQVVGLLMVVFLGITILTYAAVSIPHNFTPNTTAKASEVNANFQALADAINNRTSASLANMAGTWNHVVNNHNYNSSDGLCNTTLSGTLTLNSDGTFSDNMASFNSTYDVMCSISGIHGYSAGVGTGTFTVGTDGSGTLSYTSGSPNPLNVSFHTSKDLNTITLFSSYILGSATYKISGTAVRQ